MSVYTTQCWCWGQPQQDEGHDPIKPLTTPHSTKGVKLVKKGVFTTESHDSQGDFGGG